jgi:uncharacterized LabA/DUF88 family protein
MPYPQLPEYLFVDGAYLREILKNVSARYCDGTIIDLDYPQLFYPHDKIFYYDCLPPKSKTETQDEYAKRSEAVEETFKRLQNISGCHVFLGRTISEGKYFRQKGVDVQIAVHMLLHVFRKNTAKVTLLAGDADFRPLIDALVLEGAQITLAFERRSAAVELIEAADIQKRLTPHQILGMTSGEFKKKYPPPSVSIAGGGTGVPLVREGVCSTGIMTLHKQGEVVLLICPHAEQSGKFWYIQFSSEELAVKLAEDLGIEDVRWP